MKSMDIINIFKDRKGKSIRDFRKSGVVIPLIEKDGALHILFEIRSFNLRSQPGDVCLPGGKLEEGENYREAAARELKEELTLKDSDFDIVGEMDYFISPYGSIIYPFVAKLYTIPENYSLKEVDHVFTVPVEYFIKNEPRCHPMRIGPHLEESFPFDLIRGGRDYKFTTTSMNQYFYNYNDHVIWGFTALIIKRFADIIKESTAE